MIKIIGELQKKEKIPQREGGQMNYIPQQSCVPVHFHKILRQGMGNSIILYTCNTKISLLAWIIICIFIILVSIYARCSRI